MRDTRWTYDHLTELRKLLPLLDSSLAPSTARRRWTQRELSLEARARMDALAVAERAAKETLLAQGLKTLGNSPAPLNLTVLEARDAVTAGVAELEDAICDRLELAPLSRVSTTARIGHIVNLLGRIALHEDLADHVHDEARRLRQTARQALGEVEPVARLSLRCVVCESLSLRALLERGSVVCVNDSCRCDDPACACWREVPRRHVWPFDHWPWLLPLISEGIGSEAPSPEAGNR